MTDLAVIMSVYRKDRLKYVIQSVESVLNQTYKDFDFFIICDGPVPEEIDNFLKTIEDKRIQLFRLEKNEGLARALNYLLEKVLKNPEYKLIARMDADDISMPSRFEKQRNFFRKNEEISITGTWYIEIDNDGKHLSFRKLPTDHKNLERRYYTRTPFAHSSVMYRRNLIEAAGFYPTATFLMEDNALWGKALKAGLRFGNIPEYLVRFRIDEDFYKRRSGIKYGGNFIRTRFELNRSLKFPAYSYFVIFLIGIIKMMPPFALKFLYSVTRKYEWSDCTLKSQS